MKCPVCDEFTFVPKELTHELQVLECSKCNGYWLQSFQYWIWKENLASNLFDKPVQQVTSEIFTVNDSHDIKRCPECSKTLQKYKVGKGVDTTIERCETCRGIWFDKNEWELLASKNIHDELHLIFSSHWQKDAQQEEIDKRRAHEMESLLGADDYAQLVSFSKWLEGNKHKRDILAHINYSLSD